MTWFKWNFSKLNIWSNFRCEYSNLSRGWNFFLGSGGSGGEDEAEAVFCFVKQWITSWSPTRGAKIIKSAGFAFTFLFFRNKEKEICLFLQNKNAPSGALFMICGEGGT
jgi:hypothetical protein